MIRNLWNNCKAAFAMFSRIPTPPVDWSEENMRYMLCFFPWVGIVTGLLALLAAGLMDRLGYQSSFSSAILLLLPIVITGGIHVDGLLDTADALSSWQEREKRLQILKDSHAGAFAVITACSFFLLTYGSVTQFWQQPRLRELMAVTFFLSRSLSGLSVVLLPKASEKGTVAQFSRQASWQQVRNVLTVYALAGILVMVRIHLLCGTLTGAACLGVFALYRHIALKYFGGTSGDLAGFFLCICEGTVAVLLAFLALIF